MTWGAVGQQLFKLLHYLGFNDCFEESNSEAKLSWGEVKKKSVWKGVRAEGGFHQCDGNYLAHLYQSDKIYD